MGFRMKNNSGDWAGRQEYYRKKGNNYNKLIHEKVKCSSGRIDKGADWGHALGFLMAA